jgi:hypothetical protein
MNTTKLKYIFIVETCCRTIGAGGTQRTNRFGLSGIHIEDFTVLAGFITSFESADNVDVSGHVTHRVTRTCNLHRPLLFKRILLLVIAVDCVEFDTLVRSTYKIDPTIGSDYAFVKTGSAPFI